MQSFDNYQQNRRFRLAREEVVPFAVGLLLVASGIVCGFVIAAMTGSLAARPAAAAPAAAIKVAEVSRPACSAAAPVTVGRASHSGEDSAPMLGFLVFEQDPAAGSTLRGFGPLPTQACVLPLVDE